MNSADEQMCFNCLVLQRHFAPPKVHPWTDSEDIPNPDSPPETCACPCAQLDDSHASTNTGYALTDSDAAKDALGVLHEWLPGYQPADNDRPQYKIVDESDAEHSISRA